MTELHLSLSGHTLADKALTLTSNYTGKIVALYVKKGDVLKEGDPILRIDTRSLKKQIKEAALFVQQRTIELNGLKKLSDRNLVSNVKLAKAKTNLASAQSDVQVLEISLENATVTAPFSGILNTLGVQKGQMLGANAAIGLLVSLNPLHIQVNIPQNKIQQIHQGTLGKVRLKSNFETTGSVSYISAQSNQESHTLSVELSVNNPENRIPAGQTADVDLHLADQKAQAFSPALIILDGNGHTAVKVLSTDNKVIVLPVTIVKAERDKVWVIGLPNTVNLITVGQGYVVSGQTVDPHY